MIDLAYLGTKSLISIGYYLVRGTYNGIAYITGNEMLGEEEQVTEKDLVNEIKSLRSEMDSLRRQIKHINEDTFLLVDPDPEKDKVIAEICDTVNLNNIKNRDDTSDNVKVKQITL